MQLAGDRSFRGSSGGRIASCAVDTRGFPGGDCRGRCRARRRTTARGRSKPSQPPRNSMKTTLLPALYDDWLTPLREEYRRRISEVLHRLATLFEEQQEYAAAIPCAERLVALDSLSEAHHQLLIRLHAANHDRSSALRAYHQCMRVLRREMGVEPGPATRGAVRTNSESGAGSFPRAPNDPDPPAAKPVRNCRKCEPLVGRTTEWHRLASAWQSAVEDGPRVAVISGEPGIGKTRLADELYRIVRSARACGRAQPLLRRTGASGLRAGGGVAAFRCGSRGLDEPQAAASWRNWRGWCRKSASSFRNSNRRARTIQSARRKLAAPAFLRIAERRFRKEPEAAAAVSRRHAMVRSRLVRMAQRSVDLAGGGRGPGAGDGAGGRDGPRTSVHPVSGGAAAIGNGPGDSARAFGCRGDGRTGAPGIREPARKREPGRDLPRHPGQSAVCGGERPRRLAEHAGACRNRGAAGTAYGSFLRTGRPGERRRPALLLRIAGEGYGLGRSQRFPGARRTLAAAHHRKPRGFGVRFHA